MKRGPPVQSFVRNSKSLCRTVFFFFFNCTEFPILQVSVQGDENSGDFIFILIMLVLTYWRWFCSGSVVLLTTGGGENRHVYWGFHPRHYKELNKRDPPPLAAGQPGKKQGTASASVMPSAQLTQYPLNFSLVPIQYMCWTFRMRSIWSVIENLQNLR